MAATHSSAQQARQVLADRLRELRVESDLTGHEHARRCGWHPAKTSRIEHNKQAPSAGDIRTWCRVCTADDEADALITSLRTVEGMFLEWRRISRSGLSQVQHDLTTIHERTKRFRVYACALIPGVLQTPAYAERVFRTVQQRIFKQRKQVIDDVDQAIAARLERRQLLVQGKAVYSLVIEEHVLCTGPADPTAMTEQLHSLLDIAALANVSLGVIPASLGRDRWPVEGFWIYDDTQVSVELVSGSLTVTQAREVAVYAETFTELASLAAYGADARNLITAAINAL